MKLVSLIALVAGCSGGAPEPRSIPPKPAVAPVAGPSCITKVDDDVIRAFAADDASATVCTAPSVEESNARVQCVAVDLTTGVWRAAKQPPEDQSARDTKQTWRLVQSQRNVTLCKDKTCKELEVPAIADGYMA